MKFSIFAPISDRRSNFDLMFESFWRDTENLFYNETTVFKPEDKKNSYPKVDIKETDKAFIVEATVPGLSKEDIKVEFDEETNLLTISAESQNKKDVRDKGYFHKEIHKSSFRRSFNINPKSLDVSKIDGECKNGILTLAIPRFEELPKKEKRTININ